MPSKIQRRTIIYCMFRVFKHVSVEPRPRKFSSWNRKVNIISRNGDAITAKFRMW